MTPLSGLVVPGRPLHPDPVTAHDWLVRELSRSAYHRSLSERFSDWLNRLLERTFGGRGGVDIPLWPSLLLLLVLVLLIAFGLSRLRRNPAHQEEMPTVFGEERQTAARHRELARAAYEKGEWDEAVTEAMRAITASLIERGIVRDVPELTALEVTSTAGQRFPALEERVHGAGRVFDETRYGGRSADRAKADELLALDSDLATATEDGEQRGTVQAVPR